MSYFKYDGSLAVETAAPVNGLYGTDGVDTLTGTSVADSLWGGQGDLMTGGLGDDTYYIKSVNDRVVEAAGGGTDKIVAWTSIKLSAYANVENLEVDGDKTYGAGNAGDNIIVGGAGSQQLYGGGGQDVLVGGAGADTFIVVKGQGNDVIQDFSAGDGDVVRLSAGYTSFAQVQSHLTQVGADVKLDLGDGSGLIFRNLQVGQLTASNFQLQLDTSKLGAMTFHDEFNGQLSLWDAESNPTGTWRPDFGYQGSQGLGSYTLASNNESEIYVSPYYRDHAGDFAVNPFSTTGDGTLTITAQAVQSGAAGSSDLFGYSYTSGMISTQPTFAQTYGYFEMRAELPHAAGAWPAFWLIPADGSWPPELDVMETLTSDPNADWTTAHSGVGGVHTANGIASYIPDTTDGFHTYGVLWTPTDLTWYVDGVAVFHEATPADMNKPMYMIANLAVGGWGGAIDNSAMPAEMKIDYIHAYSLGDTTGGSGTNSSTTTAGGSTGTSAGGSTTSTVTTTVVVPGSSLTAVSLGQTLIGGSGSDTLASGQGAETFTGGAGSDLFKFGMRPAAAGHITDFQVGLDKIDISALLPSGYSGDPLVDHFISFATAGSGVKVMFDPDGDGKQKAYTLVTLDGISSASLSGAIFGTSVPATTTTVTTTTTAPPATTPTDPATSTSTSTPATTPAATGVTLTSAQYADTLTGGAGADTINAGQGPDKLTGGAGGDTFVFKNMPWSAGHITDFQVGVDKLDISALYTNGYKGSDPVADGYVSFVSNGAGGTTVLLDTDGAGAANTIKFQIATLDGVSPTGLTAAQVFGVPGPAVTPGVTLTSAQYADTLTGGAGADTINAGQGPDKLTGGAGADAFVFKNMPWNAGHITDFQVGIDKLDISALYSDGYHGSDPVADGYVSFVSNGAGGVTVLLDTDGLGSANTIKFQIATLDGVSPTGLTAAQVLGSTATTATGAATGTTASTSQPSSGQTLTSPAPGSTLAGGAGADTLHASQGADTLSGGLGGDHFVFDNLPWSAGHITDFAPGQDVLDLRPLFAAAGYAGSDPVADGYLKFESDGAGDTKVYFDSDGPGTVNPWPILVTTLDGIAPTSLHSSDWLFH